MTEGRDLEYLLDLLLPLLALPLLAPGLALTAAPELLLNLLSDTRTQTSIHFHYTAGALPGLFVAAILGRRSATPRRGSPARALVASTLVAGALLGPLPVWRFVPFGSDLASREHVVGRHAEVAARAIDIIPDAAPVSATNTLGAHLSERRRVFSFPVLREAEWIAVDTTRPSFRDRGAERARARRCADRRWRSPSPRTVSWCSGEAGGR